MNSKPSEPSAACYRKPCRPKPLQKIHTSTNKPPKLDIIGQLVTAMSHVPEMLDNIPSPPKQSESSVIVQHHKPTDHVSDTPAVTAALDQPATPDVTPAVAAAIDLPVTTGVTPAAATSLQLPVIPDATPAVAAALDLSPLRSALLRTSSIGIDPKEPTTSVISTDAVSVTPEANAAGDVLATDNFGLGQVVIVTPDIDVALNMLPRTSTDTSIATAPVIETPTFELGKVVENYPASGPSAADSGEVLDSYPTNGPAATDSDEGLSASELVPQVKRKRARGQNTCSYMYARGPLKKTKCGKPCVMDLCAKHKTRDNNTGLKKVKLTDKPDEVQDKPVSVSMTKKYVSVQTQTDGICCPQNIRNGNLGKKNKQTQVYGRNLDSKPKSSNVQEKQKPVPGLVRGKNFRDLELNKLYRLLNIKKIPIEIDGQEVLKHDAIVVRDGSIFQVRLPKTFPVRFAKPSKNTFLVRKMGEDGKPFLEWSVVDKD